MVGNLLEGNGVLNLVCSPCPDTNGDGVINVVDLIAVITNWGPCGNCPADFDGNGVVNVDDLIQVVISWGNC